MKKQLLFALSLVLLLPHVSLYAAEPKKPKSTWFLVKNGAKVLFGAWFAITGARGICDLVSKDRDALTQRYLFILDISRLYPRQFSLKPILRPIIGVSSGISIGAGSALLYSGIKGLVQDEDTLVNEPPQGK